MGLMMKKPIDVPVKTIFSIPDNSGRQDGDICRHSMWGIYSGNGRVHRFYCCFCQMIITVNFPRWTRTLDKMHNAEYVITAKWACPGCCKRAPTLMYMDENEWGWDITENEK